MKRKTIKKVLNNKIDDWLESIDSKKVKDAINNSVIVTGGAIVSMLLDEEINDYDIYFSNKEDAITVLKYYNHSSMPFDIGVPDGFQFQSPHNIDEENRIFINVQGGATEISFDVDWEGDRDEKYKPMFVSNNAISLEGDIQLIFRFIGDADTIHENYDFVHCTNYWTREDNKLTLRPEALECLLSKELRYIGSKYPICSLIRTRKYIERGFTCNAGQYLKMCWQVNELDLTDPNVLREQLVGVDIHYFNLLINALISKKKEEEDFEITYPYLAKLIERIFG